MVSLKVQWFLLLSPHVGNQCFCFWHALDGLTDVFFKSSVRSKVSFVWFYVCSLKVIFRFWCLSSLPFPPVPDKFWFYSIYHKWCFRNYSWIVIVLQLLLNGQIFGHFFKPHIKGALFSGWMDRIILSSLSYVHSAAVATTVISCLLLGFYSRRIW